MGKRDPRVDAYIERSAEFARPILTHIREVVHAACPDVEETLKWGAPSFQYHGIVCGMASFRQHAAFGFWKHELVTGENERPAEGMGSFGRLTRVSDLPPKRTLTAMVKKACRLNEDGVKQPRAAKRATKPPLPVPAELTAALKKNARARATFEKFPPSHRREYIEWITEAKREETRKRRVATTIEWLVEGKSRNWKYQ